MKIVIIGSGNVAQVVGEKLLRCNHTILQVFGRNPQTLTECAARLHAAPVHQLSQLTTAAEVYIIAASDNAIAGIATQLPYVNGIVLHTSGGISMEVLNKHAHYGVLYPLQSLRKELHYIPEIPFFVDGNHEEVKNEIAAFAKTLSKEVHFANDEERLKLHVAAVFCSNFTNHVFALAHQFCNSEQLNFNYLYPLMEETVHRMQFDAPANLQTGPAIRNDEVTIQRHLQILEAYPLLADIYKALTQSIQNMHAR